MDDQPSPVRIRSRETLSEGWFKLEKLTFEQTRRDGSEQSVSREVYHNGPGAAVLPVDRGRGTVLLVRQLRVAALVNGDDPYLLELCAGMIDEGDEPGDTVRKEASQEMGYHLENVTKLFELYMSPGASAEKLHLFLAEYSPAAHVGRGGGLRQEGEQIEIVELPLTRAFEMVRAGQIVDAKTVLLLQQLRLDGEA